MNKEVYEYYSSILRHELMPALGCTEPIAVAYAGAKAKEVLGSFPEHMIVSCSGNIVKNVKGVVVPNSGGRRGVDIAAILGAVGGDPNGVLEVLESITDEDRAKSAELQSKGFCEVDLVPGVANLYVLVRAQKGSDYAEVEITNFHTNITRIEKNGEILYKQDASSAESTVIDKSKMNMDEILEYAKTVDLDQIRDVLEKQIQCNMAIAAEGLKGGWGCEVGCTLSARNKDNDPRNTAIASAAAGSDARMGGCSMPVVINSGSGNQGMTASIPVVILGESLGKSHEEILRALCISNLTALHQKHYIGSLSAYCGAVSAATGAAAAVCCMMGGTKEQIYDTITNSLGTIGGMICDGAKSSCAAKIASALNCAFTAMDMSFRGKAFACGEGVVQPDIEGTIKAIGRVGREGMKSTDIEVLNIMLGK